MRHNRTKPERERSLASRQALRHSYPHQIPGLLRAGTARAPSVLGLMLAASILSGCTQKAEEKPQHEPEARVSHSKDGQPLITLDAATQTAMGLEIEPLKTAEGSREITAYGKVLDPAPLVNLVAELKTAEAAATASKAELARLKTLAGQNNASQRALEAAESAATRDQAQIDSARLRLISTWGTAIADRPDLPELTRGLATLEKALAQLTIPLGEPLAALPGSARLATLRDTNSISAQVVGLAASADPQFQGKGFMCLISPNTSRLVPGEAVSGFFDLPGERQTGAALPASAVVRFNGLAWTYVQTGEETFERTRVELERSLGSGWLVRRGVKPGDKVVVTGAEDLLSEELKREDAE